MAAVAAKDLANRSKRAWARKDQWRKLLSNCYEFANFQRNPYFAGDGKNLKGQAQGQSKMSNRVFDSTLSSDAIKLANRIQTELAPPGQDFATLEVGPFLKKKGDHSEANKELAEITELLFIALHVSNFDMALAEWLIELIVAGTAAMLVQEGNRDKPLRFLPVPQSTIAIEEGIFGEVWGIYQKITEKARLIKHHWKDAKITETLQQSIDDDPEHEVTLDAATYYDPEDDIWLYAVVLSEKSTNESGGVATTESTIVNRTMEISRWVIGRWMKFPGEDQGRGPVMQALPDAMTLNRVKELLLRNAALAIGGVFLVRNNAGLPNNQISIFPGATIPVQSTGGPAGASIAPLEVGGDAQLTQFVVADLTGQIHDVMLNKGLPSEEGPVRSPTEIAARLREIILDLAAPVGRLIVEGLVPMLENALYILGRAGLVPRGENGAIKLNDGNIQVAFKSRLAQSQRATEVDAITTWLTIQQELLGEEAMMVNTKMEDVGAKLGQLLDVPPELMRTEAERTQVMQGIGQAVQAQAGNVVPINGGAGGQQGQAIPVNAGAQQGGPVQIAA